MKRFMIGLLAAAVMAAFSCGALAQQWQGGVSSGTGYPANATPITASGTGTTGAIAVTLPAAVGATTYICGFVMTAGGTTAALVQNATVVGTITGTLNFAFVDPSSGQGLLGVAFPICIPASGLNTAIVVTQPAGGAGTTAANTAWGYQLRQ